MQAPPVSYRQPDEDRIKRAKALAAALEQNFPGRSIDSLSEAEKDLLFTDFDAKKDYYYGILQQQTPGVKMVGNVAVANPWDALGSAIEKGIAGYALGKSNKQERQARGIASDLLTRSDAVAEDEERRRLLEEEQRRLRYLRAIMGGAV